MPFTFTMPKLSPTMTEGVIAKWHKKEGEYVEAGDLLLEVSTDKATVEHNALDGGWLKKILLQDGQTAEVNAPLAIFTDNEKESIEGYVPEGTLPPKTETVVSTQVASKKEVTSIPSGETRLLASPLAKKLAQERGIDLGQVQGSGPSGRIMKRDLESAKAPSAAKAQPAKTKDFGKEAASSYSEEPMTPMRKVIGQRLQESKATIPHFYVRQEIDVSSLVTIREDLKKLDRGYTVNDFIIKAVALALKKHPEVNSGYNAAKQTIIRFHAVDIAIAVTINGGLITPILRNAADKSLLHISEQVKILATKAREGKLTPEEYQGGSFTISNLGMFGISEFGAIINPPQGAILAIGAIQDVPVIRNGQVQAGKKLICTLSCDHRIIDGAEAAKFAQTLKQFLENPILFLLE